FSLIKSTPYVSSGRIYPQRPGIIYSAENGRQRQTMPTLSPGGRGRPGSGSLAGTTIPLIRGAALLPIATWRAQAGSERALGEVYERLPPDERLGLRPDEPNLGIEPRVWYATGAAAAMVVEAERYHAPLDRDAYLRLLAERIMRDGINVHHR